jgi:glucose-6-phosphate isomerase
MSRALYTQSLDTAFEDSIGARGANRARSDGLRQSLLAALPALEKTPRPEAAEIYHQANREDDLPEIEALATRIAEHFSDLVVVGMGGSSMSAEALSYLRNEGGIALHIVDNIDPQSMARLVAKLPWKSTAFLVVSKSGNTVEVHAQLAVLVREAKARGLKLANQFFVVTIPNGNPLHQFASNEGIQVITHDTDMCGRFSILSAVGLIPAGAMGLNIRALRAGARVALADNFSGSMPAIDAAALHVALMEKQQTIQVLMHYSDRLTGFTQWVRQIWAESLGKSGHGTLPVPSRGATDQHSQLQLYLEGPKDKLFTALVVDSSGQGANLALSDAHDHRFDYLNGHTLGDLAMAEQRATNETLVKAGCPLRTITCPVLDEATLGALIMQFSLEVLFTAQLLGVNAFDQPAVEAGKLLTLEYLAGR